MTNLLGTSVLPRGRVIIDRRIQVLEQEAAIQVGVCVCVWPNDWQRQPMSFVVSWQAQASQRDLDSDD